MSGGLFIALLSGLLLWAHAVNAEGYEFNGGFPAPGAAQKSIDDADFMRAVTAYRFFYPAVSMEGTMQGQRDAGAADNKSALVLAGGPRHVLFTGNSDTPYMGGALNLKEAGPIVIELPPGPYLGIVNDHNYGYIADIGLPGPDAGKGGKHLILPPDYKGEAPTGYYASRSKTNLVLAGLRALPPNGDMNADDRANRGLVTGLRVDRVTYLFERAGRFALPPVSQPWWGLEGGTLRTANAAGATIEAAASIPGEAAGKSRARSNGLAFAAAGAVLLILLTLGPRLIRRGGTRATSEHEAFAAVRRACSGADAGGIYQALSHWRRLLPPGEKKGAMRAAVPLEAALFATGAPAWTNEDSQTLIGRLAHVRRSHSTAVRHRRLPPLNP